MVLFIVLLTLAVMLAGLVLAGYLSLLAIVLVGGVAALLIGPFVIGGYLGKKLRMPDHGWKIGLILFSVACAIVVITLSVLASRDATILGVKAKELGSELKLGIDLSGGVILVYEIDESVDGEKMGQMITAIGKRVNPGGVKEISIRQYGSGQIEIIVPKADENELKRLKNILTKLGELEFRILANTRDHGPLIKRAEQEKSSRVIYKDNETDDEGKPIEWGRWVLIKEGIEDSFDYPEIKKRPRTVRGKELTEVLVVMDDGFDVTGDYLTRTSPSNDRLGKPCVSFRFDAKGAQKFGGLTGGNLPDKTQDFTRKLGIVLDGYLQSAPAIQSTIFNQGEITGRFTKEEVDELVGVLNAGSLPAALNPNPIAEMVIGPTLGQDTIDRGKWAIGGSMLLVLIFMLFYYRFSGVVACMALVMNLVLILAVMITIKAAFTLPGLAGLVLTVGMAVDANVLIFERIREELNRGAALRMAIRNGFSRATTTIVDANLTTLITATVLYVIGTDQVKGFAVILWLGVVLGMFTAIFCSRVIFDIAEKRRWITELKMLRILRGTQINFLGKWKLASVVSAVVIAIGLVGVASRGSGLLDIDFTGGVSVEILFTESHDTADVRKALSDLPDLAVSDVKIAGEMEGTRFRINTSQKDDLGEQAIVIVEEMIQEVFAGQLAHNGVTVSATKAIPAAEAEADDTVLIMPGPAAMLLAQTDPTETDAAETEPTETEPTETDADETEPMADAPAGDDPAEEPAAAVEATAEPTTEATTEPAEEPATEATPEAEQQPPAAEAQPDAEPTVRDPFAGGTSATLTFDQAVNYDTLWAMFADHFGEDKIPQLRLLNPDYEDGASNPFKTWDVKILLPQGQATEVFAAVEQKLEATPFFPSSNGIGATVAGSTSRAAIAALVTSLICIIAYIWIRFQHVVYGLAAVVALVHDVLVTLGMIAISAYLAQIPGVQTILLIDPFKIGLPALAAFLTIIGYSLNDTIVVFDRIREVRGKSPHLTEDMVNLSINQTLSRTLLTSVTTLIVVGILYAGGGQGIHGFAFALVIGVMVGTYSSIFVASPALFWMSRPAEAK